jgi:hypothetical protein
MQRSARTVVVEECGCIFEGFRARCIRNIVHVEFAVGCEDPWVSMQNSVIDSGSTYSRGK